MLTTRITTRAAAIGSAVPAAARLRGTVWEHVPSAHTFYRGCLGVGALLGRAGVSANALTYGSLAFAALAALATSAGAFGWAATLVVMGGVLDLLDGVVARSTGTASKWGALLDSTVDRLSDALPLLGVALFYADHGSLSAVPVVAILAGYTVSYVRARAESLGATLPPLFMRRAERIVMVTLSLLAGLLPVAAPVPAPLLVCGVGVMGFLSFVGTVYALRAARLALNETDPRASAP